MVAFATEDDFFLEIGFSLNDDGFYILFYFLCYICISYFFFYDNILSIGKLHVQKRASSLRQVKSQVCRKKTREI